MKKIYLFAVAVIVSLALLQSVEARGTSHFSSTAHFSAPAAHYSASARSFSNNVARFNAPARFSTAARFQNRTYPQIGPRVSSAMALRNAAYLNRARFSGDRTAAFNSRSSSSSAARLTAGNRALGTRSAAFNRGRVVARYSGNWRRNWDRGRDHWWHGHRCHFRNGFWFIYDPFPFYPYGYGFYPYASYYNAPYYYDDSYATEEYAQAPETDQPQYQVDSRVSSVQSALARAGYYDGAIDGRLGPSTQKALRKYQRDHGLPATGAIDRAVIQALRLR
jgi:hypothetical protein